MVKIIPYPQENKRDLAENFEFDLEKIVKEITRIMFTKS